MQGSLEEIDINSLLIFFSQQQKSGVFFIEHEQSLTGEKDIFFVFFVKGNIVFAGDKHSFDFDRIKEYLDSFNLRNKFQHLQRSLNQSISITEYEVILLLGKKQLISILEQKDICYLIIEEIIFKIINLKTGYFTWQNTFNLQPLIISFSPENILPKIIKNNIEWHKLFPYIQNVEQKVIIDDSQKEYFLSLQNNQNLWRKIDNKTSLIQLSRSLKINIVEISKILYPYVKQGRVKMKSSSLISQPSLGFSLPISAQILCFSVINQWTLKTDNLGYNYKFLIASNLTDFFTYILNLPIKAIIIESQVTNNDNTYNLCKIIRNNTSSSDLPIIIVVDKYAFKDNLISKMYGVNEYISKNVFNKKMSHVIDKYL